MKKLAKQITKNDWKETWKKAFQASLSPDKYDTRLKELQEWDTPIASKENDTMGKWNEYEGKIEALTELIDEIN